MLSGRGKKNKWIIWVDGQAKPTVVGYEALSALQDSVQNCQITDLAPPEPPRFAEGKPTV
ncbi:hypothetical protein Z950_685 [Sulfitobacter mediterraneus KCTC 32188]|nr:hypothetical protein Z950_685 [Sulfitobacter mediterraneus KCTC 32188]